jgi:ribonuclease BN (tRNA processing enzyme)
MQGVFLGTGGFHPNERRHTACVLLPELGLAFDAGSSLFRLPAALTVSELNIVLSHAHLDHICGLPSLLVPLYERRITRCRVYGLPSVLQAVQEHLFSEPVFPVLPPFEFVPLADALELPGGHLRTVPLNHPGGCTGFRLDWGDGFCKLAYITDTVADGSYTEFIRDVDVLIHECNFPDDERQWCEKTGHSHTSQVAALAREANVGRLYLTHIDPRRSGDDPIGLAVAQAIFPETYLAEDLLSFEL